MIRDWRVLDDDILLLINKTVFVENLRYNMKKVSGVFTNAFLELQLRKAFIKFKSTPIAGKQVKLDG